MYETEIKDLAARIDNSHERLRMLQASINQAPRSLKDFEFALAYLHAFAAVDKENKTVEASRALDELIYAYRQRDPALLSSYWDTSKVPGVRPSATEIRQNFQHVLRSNAGERSSPSSGIHKPRSYNHRKKKSMAGAAEI